MTKGETVTFTLHNRTLTGVVMKCDVDERGRLAAAVIQCTDNVRVTIVTVEFEPTPAEAP